MKKSNHEILIFNFIVHKTILRYIQLPTEVLLLHNPFLDIFYFLHVYLKYLIFYIRLVNIDKNNYNEFNFKKYKNKMATHEVIYNIFINGIFSESFIFKIFKNLFQIIFQKIFFFQNYFSEFFYFCSLSRKKYFYNHEFFY